MISSSVSLTETKYAIFSLPTESPKAYLGEKKPSRELTRLMGKENMTITVSLNEFSGSEKR